jgi:hypothetical protein
MSNAPHYKANLRDIEFNLFEYLQIQNNSLGKKDFSSMDESSAKELLVAFKHLSETDLASTFYDTDRFPPSLDSHGNVTVAPQFYSCMKKFYEGGWDKIDIPERLGGFGSPLHGFVYSYGPARCKSDRYFRN